MVRADRVPGRRSAAAEPDPELLRVRDRRGPDRLGRRARRDGPRRRRARPTRGRCSASRPTGRNRSSPCRSASRTTSTASSSCRVARPRPVRPRRRDDPRDLRRLRRPGDRQREPARAARPPAARARAPARQPAPAADGQRAAALDARPEGRPRDDRGLAEGDGPVRLADDLPLRLRARASGARSSPATASPRRSSATTGRSASGITGWAVDHGEGVLANDAHVDPRSVQIPGTPFEPESMIVVPVRVGGRGRRHAEHRPDGRGRGVLQPERVRARPAVRRPGVPRARERRGPRRGQGPGRARRADRPAQPRRVPARARRHGRAAPRARRSRS